MHRIHLAFLLLLFSATPVGYAQNNTPVTVVRVGLYENAPKIYTDSNGNPAGFWPVLLEAIAQKENWQLQWVPGTWSEGLQRLESNEIDLMPDTGFTPQRAQKFDFNTETVLISWTRLYSRRGITIESFLDLEGKTVAGLADSFNMDGPEGIRDLASRFGLHVTFIEMDSYTQVFQALEEGRVEAGITNKDFGSLHENEYDIVRTPVIFQPARMLFAFPKGTKRSAYLIERIDANLRQMKEDPHSAYYQALDAYLGALEATGEPSTPPWVRTALFSAGALLLFLLLVSLVSRWQVHLRTAELRVAEERWETTLRSIGDAVIATDGHGQVTFINPVAEHLTGWREAEAHGRPLAEVFRIINEETRQPVENPAERVLRDGTVVGLANHTLLLSRDGRERPIADAGAPIRDRRGGLHGVVLVFRDQTEERAHQAQLEQHARQLEGHTRQLEGLFAAAQAINTSLSLDEVLRIIIEQVQRVLPADNTAIFLDEPQGWRLAITHAINFDLVGKHFSKDDLLFVEIAQQGVPLILADTQADERFEPWGEATHTRGWMGVPLVVRGELLGVLTLDHFSPVTTQPDLAL
ncbi:MAG: hypothetical protein Fur0018_13340 [Anaerolineales bacterium]